MPQRFYFDENDLDGALQKLDRNLMDMLDFAYLHEDMVNTIEELMSDWGKTALPSFKKLEEDYANLPDDEKDWYEDIDEYLREDGRWWMYGFDDLDKEGKTNFIHRYRLTIATCLFSNTYNYDDLMSEINESYDEVMV